MSADGRRETMQHHGVYECPDWCVQPDDEEQYEEHVGEGATVPVDDVDLLVRPLQSWWEDANGVYQARVVVSVIPPAGPVLAQGSYTDPDSVHDLFMTVADWEALRDVIDDQLSVAETAIHDGDTRWAYAGAEEDAEAVAEQAALPAGQGWEAQ